MSLNNKPLNIQYKIDGFTYEENSVSENIIVLSANISQLKHMEQNTIYRLEKEERVVYNPSKMKWFGYDCKNFIGTLLRINHNLFYYNKKWYYSEIKFVFKVPSNDWETETYFYRIYNNILANCRNPEVSIDDYINTFYKFNVRFHQHTPNETPLHCLQKYQ